MDGDWLQTGQDLASLRHQLGYSQSQMAEAIGLSLRQFQEIEGGKSELRKAYAMACELLSLRTALGVDNMSLALPRIRRDAVDYANLIRREQVEDDKAVKHTGFWELMLQVKEGVPGAMHIAEALLDNAIAADPRFKTTLRALAEDAEVRRHREARGT